MSSEEQLEHVRMWLLINNLKALEVAKKRGYKMDQRIRAANLK